MTALLRYNLRDFVRSQRVLPPLLAFAIALAVLYSVRPTPVLSSYGTTALCLYPLAAWYTAALLGAEDATQRQVTLVNGGGPARGYLAKVCAAGLLLVPLVLIALVGPALLGFLQLPPTRSNPALALLPYLGVGLLAHLTTALPGIGVAVLWSPPLVQRPGYTLAGTLLCLLGTVPLDRLHHSGNGAARLLALGLSPLAVVRAMRDGTAPVTVASHLLPSLLGGAAFTALAASAYLRASRTR